jgi:flagellar biosynthesis protein FliQ
MSYALVLDLARNAMLMAVMLAGPLLLVALAVGLLVGVMQAVTQIQEQTIAFVAKLFSIGVVFMLLLNWMMQTAVKFTTELIRSIPGVVG